jgi:hypothetical protein
MDPMCRRIFWMAAGALPGLALAVAAKPLLLGEWALWVGTLLAFAGPVMISLAARTANPSQRG